MSLDPDLERRIAAGERPMDEEMRDPEVWAAWKTRGWTLGPEAVREIHAILRMSRRKAPSEP